MEELQTINEIVNESVKNSSYVTVIISSCVFILYTLITRLIDYFKAKTKDKPLLEMSKAMTEMGDNIVKLNAVLNKTFDEAERKEIRQCEKAIQVGFKALAFKLSQESAAIIAHNNIEENKSLILENLNKVASTEYYRLYSALSAYEIKEVNVASKLKEEWVKELVNAIVTIIYDGQDSVMRIAHINDRISILTNDYSTYISTKIFNT